MKNLLLSAAIFFLGLMVCRAQAPDKRTEAGEEEPVFTLVEVQPEYPGGIEAMYKFITDNVRYPVDAKKAGIQGKVYLKFTVDPQGNIGEVKVLRGVSESIDAEAVRVINAMPKWKPGTQGGKPVNVFYNLPLEFKLN